MKEGYKKTEVGVIPEDWEVKKLEKISNIIMGQSPNSDSYNDDKIGVPFFQGNSEFGRINPTVKKWCSEPIKIVEPLDILISVRAPVGAVNINTYRSCIGRGLGAIRANYDTNYKYLFYVMVNSRNVLNSSAQGSTFTAINSGDLKNHKVAIPPLKEQEKIAEILSTVDYQIADTEKLIEKCRVLKKGLMQRLLTKGIGHTEFKKTEVGEIPVGWEVKKLGEVSKIINGGTPDTREQSYWEGGNIKWSTPTDITKNSYKYITDTEKTITEEGLKSSSANLLPIGSILMSSRATIGERAINTVPMSTNQGFKSFICSEELNNEYLYYYIDILRDKMINLSSGSTFLEISKKEVELLKIALPKLEEQEKIAQILSSVDNEIEEYKNKKQTLEELKKGLMQQLLTGEVRTMC